MTKLYLQHHFSEKTTFNADYYQTDFLNRVVFDLEESSHIKFTTSTARLFKEPSA